VAILSIENAKFSQPHFLQPANNRRSWLYESLPLNDVVFATSAQDPVSN
jgi:hypothetical protein